MQNPFGKIQRYLVREYPVTTLLTTGMTGAGLGAAGCFLLLGAPLALPALVAGGAFGISLFASAVLGADDRKSGNALELNGFTLIGDERALNSIHMTQELINRETLKLRHVEEVPAKTAAKIQQHIDDIENALRHVRVYKGKEQVFYTEFAFDRKRYGDNGDLVSQKIPCVRQGWEHQMQVRQVAEGLPAPKALPAHSAEFNRASETRAEPETDIQPCLQKPQQKPEL